MNKDIEEAIAILKKHGSDFDGNDPKTYKEGIKYFAALGVLLGLIEGLLLYAPKEVQERLR